MLLFHTKKFRHGSVSIALTVVIIAAVILLNAIFGALSAKYLWYLDMTTEQIFTLSEDAKALVDRVNRDVTITFCTERDTLEENQFTRYPLYTALQLADENAHVKVRFVDWSTNPSAVAKYKESAGQNINNYSIIIASGTGDPADSREESRVYQMSALYTQDTAGTTYNGYCGEQRLVSAVLAVTQLELPVAAVTVNHGETEKLAENPALLTLLYDAGYELKDLNLAGEEIPADCRLLVIYAPQSDFQEFGAISEISKLEAFLDAGNAVMVFFDYTTPKLPYLEEFLEAWGVTITRAGDANYLIKDSDHSYTAAGYTNVAQYVTDGGLGSTLTRVMWENVASPKNVLFPYATAIGVPETYLPSADDYLVYQYNKDGAQRERYNVFTSYDTALAMAGGTQVSAAAPFTYMSITRENKVIDNFSSYSYVLACSSTDFTMTAAMASSYGNHAVLSYACNVLGRAYASISLDTKYFANTEISTITAKAANQYTAVLTAVPAGLIFIAGIYVIVRRKYK